MTGMNAIPVETDTAPPSFGHRSQAIILDDYLFCGGQVGAPLDHGQTPDDRAPLGTLADQVRMCLTHLQAVTDATSGPRQVVEVSAFIAQPDARDEVVQIIADFLGHRPPVLNYEEVETVALHGLVELDWIAVGHDATEAVDVVRAFGNADTSAGPLISGPFTVLNDLRGAGDTLAQASEAVLERAAAALATVGSGLDDIVKMTVFIDEFDTYPQFNDATKQAFRHDPPPTRSVLVAPEVTRPARIRIDVVAA